MQFLRLNETCRMIGYSLLSNDVNFVEIGFKWLRRKTTFLCIPKRISPTKSVSFKDSFLPPLPPPPPHTQSSFLISTQMCRELSCCWIRYTTRSCVLSYNRSLSSGICDTIITERRIINIVTFDVR